MPVPDVVLIPFGSRLLALDRDQFERALQRGDRLLPPVVNNTVMQSTATDEPLLSADQAAALLRLPVKTLYRQAKAGKLPAVKVGRFYRFRRSILLGGHPTGSESVG